jgi:fumarate reductase iron-sulfur subunit
VVKDLVADMREFFDKWARARGHFKPSASRADAFAEVKPDSRERIEADAGIECIGCGICYAACDVVTWNRDYLGPAALNRAWTLVNDARDAGQGERLDAVAGDAGCHSCHTLMSCTEHCPTHLSPTRSISGLKRATMKLALGSRGTE